MPASGVRVTAQAPELLVQLLFCANLRSVVNWSDYRTCKNRIRGLLLIWVDCARAGLYRLIDPPMNATEAASRPSVPCRTLLVEDHPVLGDLLASRLAMEKDFIVVGMAGSADQALELLVSAKPEMLVLDLGLPSPAEGLRVLSEARRISPQLKIVAYSASSTVATVHRSMKAGVDGFVVKTATWDELLLALRRVREGHRHLDAEVSGRLVEAVVCDARGLLLEDREIRLLRYLAEGAVVKAIAEDLAVSVPMIYKITQNMRAKLNSNTNEEMLHRAYAMGYLEITANSAAAPPRDELS